MVAHARGDRLIVVGNGMVGWHFCRRLVELGLHERFAIEVYGDDPLPAYDRIRLNEVVADGRTPDELLLATPGWYAEHDIRLTNGREVLAIEPQRGVVRTIAGERSFARLVLATGSTAARLTVPGADLPCVRCYRTVADAQAIAELARPGLRVVLVGGGLLGIELAAALALRGAAVTVLERSPGILVRQLNVVASTLLRRRIEALGITIETEARVASIEAQGDGAVVHREDGINHAADLVVTAIGIRPRDELARDAGITCSPAGGIVIDHFLRSSAPNVHAIGECARFQTSVYGLVAPGYHMADVLARRLAGQREVVFTGFDQGTRLKLVGIDVATLGEFQADGITAMWRDGDDYRQVVVRDGRLVGATVIGAWEDLPRVADAVARREAVDTRDLRAFRRGGSPVRRAPVAEWPAAALVCACRSVSRGAIGHAILAGAADPQALGRSTGAGTVCGGCRPLLAELCGLDPRLVVTTRFPRLLTAAGVLALATVALALTWSVPRATSWGDLGGIERWWRDPLLNQASGYAMAGLALLSCALVLRKRVRWCQWLDIGWWRLAHVGLAWIAALALALHTGLRLGYNLNRVLALLYLTVIALGGVAAIVVAWEARLPLLASARQWLVRLHIGAVWLLLPFLIFHLVEVYRW